MLIRKEELRITCEQGHPGDEEWVAKAVVPADLSAIIPYVNAVATRPELYPETPVIVWMLGEQRVALRPHEIAVSHVADREQAAVEVGKIADWLNELWERRNEITPRPKPRELPPLMSVLRLLPMNNCGRCGLSTCTAFSVGLIEGRNSMRQCSFLSSEGGRRSTAKLRDMGLE